MALSTRRSGGGEGAVLSAMAWMRLVCDQGFQWTQESLEEWNTKMRRLLTVVPR